MEEVFKVFLQRNSASKATGFICKLSSHLGFPLTQSVKNQPAVQETLVRSLGQEDPLKKEMATHSSILAWRIPWAEEPGRLQSMMTRGCIYRQDNYLHVNREMLFSRGSREYRVYPLAK